MGQYFELDQNLFLQLKLFGFKLYKLKNLISCDQRSVGSFVSKNWKENCLVMILKHECYTQCLSKVHRGMNIHQIFSILLISKLDLHLYALSV